MLHPYQRKLEVVKQMTRVNIDILEISELNGLKWVNLIQMTIYIYYCGQESLRRNGVALIVNKRVRNAVLGCNLKNNRMILVHFQGKPFNFSFFSFSDWGIHLHYCDIECFALKTEIILLFSRLHPSTAFWTLLLTMMATPFLLRDSCL